MKPGAFIGKEKIYSALAGIIIFSILIFIIMSSWKKEEAPYQKKDSYNLTDYDSADLKKHESKKIQNSTQKKDLAPELRNIGISEFPQPNKEKLSPAQLEHKKISRLITLPINSIKEKLSSFIYEGSMQMSMPTFNTDQKTSREGKRFGPNEDVTSSFTLIKDENGNSKMIQKTEGNSLKYSEDSYNGILTSDNGKFSYTDSDGNEADKGKLDQIISDSKKKHEESFVRQNWIKLIANLNSVISFQKSSEEKNGVNYEITGSNPELQKNSTELTEIEGSFIIDESLGVMKSASITGSAKLHDGFMSGAEVQFQLNLELKQIGNIKNKDDY